MKLKANKQNAILTLVFIIILALLFSFREDIKYMKTQSIDLSKENIGGLYLDEKYNLDRSKKIFGDENRVVSSNERNRKVVQFLKNTSIAVITIDTNDDSVVRVFLDDTYGSINTSKNINSKSSLEDIVREYGKNYSKRTWKDFMGSGDGYIISYIDKKNKYKLEFGFSQATLEEEIDSINFSKY